MRQVTAGIALLTVGLALMGEPAAEQAPTTGGAMAAAVADGMAVQIDYTLTVDGQVVDSSKDRGPLAYTHGRGEIIPGLERQLVGLHAGDVRDVTVSPQDGYGAVDPQAFVEVPRSQLPPDVTPEVGTMLRGTSQDGRPFQARIHAVVAENVTLDLNHPMAGKTLQFHVTVVNVQPGG